MRAAWARRPASGRRACSTRSPPAAARSRAPDRRVAPGRTRVRTQRSGEALEDAEVALGAVAQRLQRFLVAGAVVRRVGLGEALELDQHRALAHALLVGLGGQAAREEFSAVRL